IQSGGAVREYDPHRAQDNARSAVADKNMAGGGIKPVLFKPVLAWLEATLLTVNAEPEPLGFTQLFGRARDLYAEFVLRGADRVGKGRLHRSRSWLVAAAALRPRPGGAGPVLALA